MISSNETHKRLTDTDSQQARLGRLKRDFKRVLDRLGTTRAFAKGMHQTPLFSAAMRLLDEPDGAAVLYDYAPDFDAAGVFAGGVWDAPAALQPGHARAGLLGAGMNPPVEALSALRILAIAQGQYLHATMTPAAARAFLEDVLARNLDLLFPPATEAARMHASPNAGRIRHLFEFITAQLGTAGILAALVAEVERVLRQRPIMVERVENLLHALARSLPDGDAAEDAPAAARARALVAALEGPTDLCRRHAGNGDYAAALTGLDAAALGAEARALGQSMDATGLVSPPQALFLRFAAQQPPGQVADALLADALALGDVGRTDLAEHRDLVVELVDLAVTAQTERCVYGLSRLLDRGILSLPPVAPGLRRLAELPIHPEVGQQLQSATGYAGHSQPARTLLLAGTLSVIGQPCGMDQGHNPTCQGTRAISLWSHNDVGYLLALIADAARDNDVVAQFEGDTIHSSALSFGLAGELHRELDPVSLLLTPHLDKIYMEMSRRTIGRGGDGHRWVNPEQHGWWVYRGFAAVVDTQTGTVSGFEPFIRRFYAAYHPQYNGGRDLVYAQPCGVAVTDHDGVFVGWHAVSILRVACDDAQQWRVYFFNPNRDKAQDWGQGVVTSIFGHGEREGESSLPFEQFAARLYVFHYQEQEIGALEAVPAETVAGIRAAAAASWAAQRVWPD